MSDAIIIHNAKIITPYSVLVPGWMVCVDQKIRLVGEGQPPEMFHAEMVDAHQLTVLPGFIDVHVHGSDGADTMDANADTISKMAAFFARHGVTAFLATTWTDSREKMTAALKMIAEKKGQQVDGATLLGAHLEGPYLNPEKCGAQSAAHIRRATEQEAQTWLDLDVIRLVALAPEFGENHWLIEECQRRGVTVSAAHTSASYEQMQTAVELGVRHATHTYNAMSGLHHRSPGVVGAVMTMPEINCELVCDNIHVHPAATKILHMVKGLEKIILITDAMRGAGLPEGEYELDGDRSVTVRGSAVRLLDGTLAGSTLVLNEGLRNFVEATDEPIERAWRVSSLNAAQSIGIDDRKGSLEPGKDADFVIVDDEFNVYMTIAEGRVVYRSEQAIAQGFSNAQSEALPKPLYP